MWTEGRFSALQPRIVQYCGLRQFRVSIAAPNVLRDIMITLWCDNEKDARQRIEQLFPAAHIRLVSSIYHRSQR